MAILAEFVEINPSVPLVQGIEYPCVMMEDITPGNRYIHVSKRKLFKGGGSKFQKGDVLFARITPCLENGKIAQFTGIGEIGFGSTEFFVFRCKEGISEPGYVFYLASSDFLRKPAEKSMFGASGRQRVDLNIVKMVEVPAPPLSTQRKIAAILSAYDDLIENNTRRIKILEEMAQSIYREWFVHYRFPGHENLRMVDSGTELGKIPDGWEVVKFGEIIDLVYGKGLREDARVKGSIPVFGSSGIVGFHNVALVNGPGIIVGRKGNVGSVFWTDVDFYPIDTTYYVKSKLSLHYVFYNLQYQNFLNNDAAVPGLSRNQANLLPFLVPPHDLVERFEIINTLLFLQKRHMETKNTNLCYTRDLLLPKLVSGELDVSKTDLVGCPLEE
jgi:type I restriction enzyme S subunit